MNQVKLTNFLLVLIVFLLIGLMSYLVLNKTSLEVSSIPTKSIVNTEIPAAIVTPVVSSESATVVTIPALDDQAEDKNLFINSQQGLQFVLPSGYSVNSNTYGVTDPAKAESFFFRRITTNYDGVPLLDVSANHELAGGQTFAQFVQSIYDLNKSKNYVTTVLTKTNKEDAISYEFGLQNGYIDAIGSKTIDSIGGKVVFIYKGGKIFKFLQTGNDINLDSILKGVKLK